MVGKNTEISGKCHQWRIQDFRGEATIPDFGTEAYYLAKSLPSAV